MKNELKVKEVPFLGDTILAAQDGNGKVWVGVKWMCEGVGLSDGQSKGERKRIQEDEVLQKGGRNMTLPTNGGNQSVLCIAIDYVPLWLAKISITPAMRRENPELAERLTAYQLRAKDVLAEAFLPKQHRNTEDDPLKQMDIEARKLRAEAMRLNAKTKIARTVLDAYKEAGVNANYQVLALNQIYSEVGIHLPFAGLKVDEPSFDKEAIAKQLGILSKNGKPHPQAVGAIIEKVGAAENEIVKVPFIKNGHSGSCNQYTESVVQRVEIWLKENGYPTVIQKDGGNKINVRYAIVAGM